MPTRFSVAARRGKRRNQAEVRLLVVGVALEHAERVAGGGIDVATANRLVGERPVLPNPPLDLPGRRHHARKMVTARRHPVDADLVVGTPWYDTIDDVDAGIEFVLYGSLFSDGFETGSTARWSSETP